MHRAAQLSLESRQSVVLSEHSVPSVPLASRHALIVPSMGGGMPVASPLRFAREHAPPPLIAVPGLKPGRFRPPSPRILPAQPPPPLDHHPASRVLYRPDWVRRVEASPPTRPGVTTVLDSGVCPGSVVGSRFACGYRNEPSAGCYEKALSRHVPDLAFSTLANASGERLYSGLQHGFVGLAELTGPWLRQLDDESLLDILLEFVVHPEEKESEKSIEERRWQAATAVRKNERVAWACANAIRHQVSNCMTNELAAAAIVTDPVKSRCAATGDGRVDVPLLVIALTGPGDAKPWATQYVHFATVGDGAAICTWVHGPDGNAQPVRVNLRIRPITLSTDPGHDPSCAELFLNNRQRGNGMDTRHFCERLLGSPHSSQPAGVVGEHLQRLQGEVKTTRHLRAAQVERWRGTVEWAGPHVLREPNPLLVIERIERAQQGLQKKVRALRETWEQLQQLRAGGTGWAAGPDITRKVAARLALIGHLIGEMPVLSCRAGDSGLVRQLDAEVKYLAAAADSNDGAVPPIDADLGEWKQYRSAFAEP